MAEASAQVHVVVIDDDTQVVKATGRILRAAGFLVTEVSDPIEGMLAAAADDVDVVLSDVQMPNLTGIDLLRDIRSRGSTVEVVLMAGQATVESAVAAVKAGAFDYFTKPLEDYERLARTLSHAAAKRKLATEAVALHRMLEVKESFEDLVGQSVKMTEVFKLIDSVAYASSTVVIQGESGTGKELVARALHRRSPRSARPFLAVNCSALTETLLDSELFGHVKGAFTGAHTSKRGLFQAAHRGTLFLDEIGDMPLNTQVRLLRVLQEGEVRPVGSTEAVAVDVRVVAATNLNLEKATAAGKFREDLYYRLNVISVQLPPLRDRPEDIAPLVQHFLQHYSEKTKKRRLGITAPAIASLIAHSWPGNVRELENVIERAVVLAQGENVTEADLPAGLGAAGSGGELEAASLVQMPYYQARDLVQSAFERRYAAAAMRRSEGNISKAAELAGVDRSNFRRILKQHGIAARVEPDQSA